MKRFAGLSVGVIALGGLVWLSPGCTTTGKKSTATATSVAATPTPTATSTPFFSVHVQDSNGTPISGAPVMLGSNAAGAVNSDANGNATFAGVTYPVDVHAFAPSTAGTPAYFPLVNSALGVTSSTLTIGTFGARVTPGTLTGSINNAVNTGDIVRLRWSQGYALFGANAQMTAVASSGYTFSNSVPPSFVQLQAVEYNSSPTASPVAAAYYNSVPISGGVTNNLTISLTPISYFTQGTTTLSVTYNSTYPVYGLEVHGGPADTQDFLLGNSGSLCGSNCSVPTTWIQPGGVTNVTLIAIGASLSFTDLGATIFHSSSIPSSQSATYIGLGTVTQNPSTGTPSLHYTNTSGVTASLVHWNMQPTPSAGNGNSWEVFAPGLAPAATAVANYPGTFPAGVPATYRPQTGTNFSAQLAIGVANLSWTGNVLTPQSLFPNLTQISLKGASFTY